MAQTHDTEPGGEQSVLAGLDSSAMSSLYWYLALLACIGGFLFGYDTAVIGSVLDFIPYHLSAFWTGEPSPVTQGITSRGFRVDHLHELGWLESARSQPLAKEVAMDLLEPLAKRGVKISREVHANLFGT